MFYIHYLDFFCRDFWDTKEGMERGLSGLGDRCVSDRRRVGGDGSNRAVGERGSGPHCDVRNFITEEKGSGGFVISNVKLYIYIYYNCRSC
jgi:hypothetical protein